MRHHASLTRVMTNHFKATSKEIVNRYSEAIEKKFHRSGCSRNSDILSDIRRCLLFNSKRFELNES